MEEGYKAKETAIILLVVLLGLVIVCGGMSYIYSSQLNKGPCDLCFELNPHLEVCRGVAPVNFSNITIPPFVSYGK